MQNLDFGASVDPAYKEMQPKIDQYDMDLQADNTSNVTLYDEGALLNMTDVAFMKQPYATKGRQLSEDELMYVGVMTLHPSYDPGYDVTRAPDFNIEVDHVTPFADFTTNLNKYASMSSVQKSTASTTTETASVSSTRNIAGTLNTTVTATTEIVKELQISKDSETDQRVGDFVTDIRFTPFMKSKEISVLITGVRPNTRLYFFFDNISVDNEIANATAPSSTPFKVSSFRRSSAFGSSVTSDSRGRARAIFRIRPNSYFVGTRKLKVYDINDLDNLLSDAKTTATAEYNAFNYSVQKQNVNVSTRQVAFDVRAITSVDVVTQAPLQPYYNSTQGVDSGGWHESDSGVGFDDNDASDSVSAAATAADSGDSFGLD